MFASIRDWLEGLNFSEPVYFAFFGVLFVLIAVVAVIIILKRIFRPIMTNCSRYRLFGKDTVWVAALFIFALSVIALVGPKVNKGVKLIPGGNIDVGFLVDTSFSTRADDINGKTRLDVAKTVIVNFVDSGILKPGDRLTLFVFGTISVWRMPLSEDFNEFKSQLAEINHPQVYWDDLQLYTDISNVIELVPEDMDKQDDFFKKTASTLNAPWFKNNRIMFLFSDGDDKENADLGQAIKELNKRDIKVFSVGVGAKDGKKVTVDVYDLNNPDKTVKKTIETKLETRRLNEIAIKTGGELYVVDSATSVRGAQSFLKNAVNSNRNFSPRLIASGESRDIWWEILAIPAVLLLLVVIKKI